MRAASRLLAAAAVQPARYLEAGTPTGLCGILTHATPRSTLLYLYNDTLDKLARFPAHSVYRASVEGLTRHRLSVIESVKPAGLEEWQNRVKHIVDANPGAFRKVSTAGGKDGGLNFVYKESAVAGMETPDYDDEPVQKAEPEGPRHAREKAHHHEAFSRDLEAENAKIPRIEQEPPLSVEQIEQIESQIQAGLLEEIIVVAENENKLVDTMYESKVWEDLEVAPAPGQWQYHERDTHTPTTQAP